MPEKRSRIHISKEMTAGQLATILSNPEYKDYTIYFNGVNEGYLHFDHSDKCISIDSDPLDTTYKMKG